MASSDDRGADALAFHVIATRLGRALAGRGLDRRATVQLEIRGDRRTFHGVLRLDGRRLSAEPGIARDPPAARVIVPAEVARAIATGAEGGDAPLEISGDVALVESIFERMTTAPSARSWLGMRSSA